MELKYQQKCKTLNEDKKRRAKSFSFWLTQTEFDNLVLLNSKSVMEETTRGWRIGFGPSPIQFDNAQPNPGRIGSGSELV